MVHKVQLKQTTLVHQKLVKGRIERQGVLQQKVMIKVASIVRDKRQGDTLLLHLFEVHHKGLHAVLTRKREVLFAIIVFMDTAHCVHLMLDAIKERFEIKEEQILK
jgi:hypothetical protein